MSLPISIAISEGTRSLDIVRRIRFRVLREPLDMPYDSTLFAGDELASTLHCIAYSDAQPTGCLTLLVPSDPQTVSKGRLVQLRGMAVLPGYQGAGVGGALLRHVQEMAGLNGWDLWCNARADAVAFYAKHGWQVDGAPFEIPRIGPHYVMRWKPHASGE